MNQAALKKKIRNIIDDYLATNSIDFPGSDGVEGSFADLIEGYSNSFSSDALAQEIAEMVQTRHLEANTYRYEETANPMSGGGLTCSECYRSHGEWRNNFNAVSDDRILRTGTKIVLLED
jgi:hypothetical protein